MPACMQLPKAVDRVLVIVALHSPTNLTQNEMHPCSLSDGRLRKAEPGTAYTRPQRGTHEIWKPECTRKAKRLQIWMTPPFTRTSWVTALLDS